MTQATELALREALEKHLEKHPLYETVYIKIVDNTVHVATSISDMEKLKQYPPEGNKV